MDNFIVLKLSNGTKYNVSIDNNETILSLKDKIYINLNIEQDIQKLFYKKILLVNKFNLIKLPNKSIIHLVLQLPIIVE